MKSKIPKAPGWYWFKADDRTPSPTGFVRKDKWVIVLVSSLKVTRDGPPGPLVVRFPQANYMVDDLGGEWSERLKEPN